MPAPPWGPRAALVCGSSTHSSNSQGSSPMLGLVFRSPQAPALLPRLLIPPKHPRAPVSKTLSASRQILPKSFAEHGLSACPKPIDKLKHLPWGIILLKLGAARAGANLIFC